MFPHATNAHQELSDTLAYRPILRGEGSLKKP